MSKKKMLLKFLPVIIVAALAITLFQPRMVKKNNGHAG